MTSSSSVAVSKNAVDDDDLLFISQFREEIVLARSSQVHTASSPSAVYHDDANAHLPPVEAGLFDKRRGLEQLDKTKSVSAKESSHWNVHSTTEAMIHDDEGQQEPTCSRRIVEDAGCVHADCNEEADIS